MPVRPFARSPIINRFSGRSGDAITLRTGAWQTPSGRLTPVATQYSESRASWKRDGRRDRRGLAEGAAIPLHEALQPLLDADLGAVAHQRRQPVDVGVGRGDVAWLRRAGDLLGLAAARPR